MTYLQRCACYATLIGLGLAATNGANAQGTINGYKINARVFNDNPGSTLTITPAGPIGANPATITIRDEFTGAFSGANRHDAMASSDGGTNAFIHSIDGSFLFTTRLTLTDGFNAPRKEAGIRINSSPASGVGDALFLVNSDAGEIVTFGGGAPFHIFGSNGGGNGYTPGTSILLGIRHIGGGDGAGGVANTIEFFIDRGAGIETTGPQPWSNLEGGPVNFQVGVYVQGGASTSNDFVNALFTNTTYTLVPTFTNCPASTNLGCNPVGIPGCDQAVGATDNCSVPTVTCFLTQVTNGCVRTRTITYKATDACGNSNTCVQVITWTADTTPPVFTNCPASTNLGCNPASIPGCDPAVGATDDCSVPTMKCVLTQVTNECVRTRTITYTATDACGNSNTCEQVITWTVGTATAPVLSIELQSANAVISWPVTCGTCVLEQTPSLSPPITWTPTPGPIVVVGCRNAKTFAISTNNTFYRLRCP